MADPYINDVKLLVHSEALDGSATFTDTSRNSLVVPYSTAQHSTAQSKFGTSSIKFDGVNDHLIAKPIELSGGPMTVEMWVFTDPTQSGGGVFSVDQGGSIPVSFGFADGTTPGNAGLKPYFGFYSSINVWECAHSADDIATYQWVHVAGTYDGTTMRLFVGGVLKASLAATMPAYLGTAYIGANWSGYYKFKGSLEEVRLTVGTCRYTTTFSPPTDVFDDPVVTLPNADDSPLYWAETALLMHGEGDNNSTYFVDERHRRMAVTGAAKITTAEKKFGSGSMMFDGTTSRIAITDKTGLGFGGNDYTIECFFRTLAANNSYRLLSIDDNPTLSLGSGIAQVYPPSGGVIYGPRIPPNTWFHLACVRASGVVSLYIDGMLMGTVDGSPSVATPTTAIIGSTSTGSETLYGQIDELRITNGVARYTGRFNPPTKAFSNLIQYDSNWQDVVLLMQMRDTGLTDRKMHAVSKLGNVTRSVAQAKFKGASAYFDGVGDYLSVTPDDRLNLGTGDFTIETWFFYAGTTNTKPAVLHSKPTWEAGAVGVHVDHTWGVNKITLAHYDHSTAVPILASSTLTLNVWYHAAFVRQGNNIRLFLNGADGGSVTVSGSLAFDLSTSPLTVGIATGDAVQTAYKGYIQDLRVTKGVARYTGTFAALTEPHPAYDFSTTIGGVVKDHTGAFAARRVNIHSQATGELLGSTVSNATTGAWEFVVNQMCYAVALDNEISKRKAIVFDRIEPS